MKRRLAQTGRVAGPREAPTNGARRFAPAEPWTNLGIGAAERRRRGRRRDDQSLAFLNSLYAAPVGLGFWDTDLRFVRINQTLAAISGLPPEEHIGRTLAEVLPELGPPLADLFRKVMQTGEPVTDFEISGETAAQPGETRHWLASYYPVIGPEGETLGVGAAVRDVTERRRLAIEREAALARAEAAQRMAEETAEVAEAARAAAEAARQRAAFLADAGAVLDSSLSYEETLGSVVRLAVPDLADWAMVDLLQKDGSIERVAVAHVDPAKEQVMRDLRVRYPLDPDGVEGPAKVIRAGEPDLIQEVSDEVLERFALDDEHLKRLQALGLRSAMIVPLRARGKILGALTFVSTASGPRYNEDDLAMAVALANRCGLSIDNSRLYAERVNVARTLQNGLLPKRLPRVTPGLDMAVRYRAAAGATDVGGDFYDVFPSGEGWKFIVGDVVGKGPLAATVTGLARHTIRAVALYERDPSDVLRVLDRALHAELSDSQYCTVACAHVDVRNHHADVVLALGGHPMPLVLRSDGRVEPIGSYGQPLGLLDRPELRSERTRLETGDTLLLYTDGVLDARGSEGMFGERRLIETLAACKGLPAAEIVETIESAAVDFQAGDLRDDIAIVAVRRAP
jgi:PAS domain S-box-containing protein